MRKKCPLERDPRASCSYSAKAKKATSRQVGEMRHGLTNILFPSQLQAGDPQSGGSSQTHNFSPRSQRFAAPCQAPPRGSALERQSLPNAALKTNGVHAQERPQGWREWRVSS